MPIKCLAIIFSVIFLSACGSGSEDKKTADITIEMSDGSKYACSQDKPSGEISGTIDFSSNLEAQPDDLLLLALMTTKAGAGFSEMELIRTTCQSGIKGQPIPLSFNFDPNQISNSNDYFIMPFYARLQSNGKYQLLYSPNDVYQTQVLTQGFGNNVNIILDPEKL
jgi:hypothetical protein